MSDRLQELIAFVRAAERASFSAAARDLETTQPSVSRMVSALEDRLGVKLLLRTTRRVSLTEAGARFLEHGRRVLDDLAAADDAARGVDSLKGVLRVALSGAFGHREVIPRLPVFLARHPDLTIELVISDQAEDLVAERVDMALRFGRLEDSGFGARRLGQARRYLVAAPAYLARHGIPLAIGDLVGHDCITGPGASGREGWVFDAHGKTRSIAVEGRVRVATAEGVVACAKAGLGIAIASQWMCRAELESGELVAVLPRSLLAPVEVHAVYPGGPRTSAKVRAFSDFLADGLGASPSPSDALRPVPK